MVRTLSIGRENLGDEVTEDIQREKQSGAQCGIHSSLRIIPRAIYHKTGVQDCDILALVEPNS